MHYFTKATPEFGRGLYASYDMRAQMMLFTDELLVLSPEDTKKIDQTDLRYYVYKYNDEKDCLALGHGTLFNHSDNPNIGYKIMEYGDREVIAFYTLRPIEAYEQLFIDYNADCKVDMAKYMSRKSVT